MDDAVDQNPAPLSQWPMEVARSGVLSVLIGLVIASGYLDFRLRMRRLPGLSRRARANWMSGISRSVMRLLGIRLKVCGNIPDSGLIIANHLSYLDIVVLNAVTRCLFVSKVEVADYPIFGECGRWAGIVFIDRKRRSAVADVAAEMRGLLENRVPLVLFPEGTTSDGDSVLPFKPSLFASVIESGSPVYPCAISYSLETGNAPDVIHYWGGARLLPHIFRMLGKAGITASLNFGEPFVPSIDRKAVARELHERVTALREGC